MVSLAWRAILLMLLLGGAGCASPARHPTGSEGVASVRLAAAGVELRNPTDRPIFYAAFEREFAIRSLFVPCSDVARCPSVAPGATRTIPLAEVTGYRAGAEAVMVYYWHLAPGDGGYVVENMKSVLLPIRS